MIRIELGVTKNMLGEVCHRIILVNEAFELEDDEPEPREGEPLSEELIARARKGAEYEAEFRGHSLPRRFYTEAEAQAALDKCEEREEEMSDADDASMLPYDYAVELAEAINDMGKVKALPERYPEWSQLGPLELVATMIGWFANDVPAQLEIAKLAVPMVTEPMGRTALEVWIREHS